MRAMAALSRWSSSATRSNNSTALADRGVRPWAGVEGLSSGGYRQKCIIGSGLIDLGHEYAVGRAMDLTPVTGQGRNPATVDVQFRHRPPLRE